MRRAAAHLPAAAPPLRIWRLAALVGQAAVLAACGAGPAVEDVGRAHTVIIAYGGDEWAMSPAWDDTPRRLVFQHMVYYDELWCGEPKPGIAERWEHSPDLREWTLRLRRDNRWHDGTPVTAHDVKFTIDLWNHPDVDYWYGRDVDSVVVIDDHTLRLHHSKPSRMALDSWIVYYPKHLLEHLDPKDFYRWEFWTRPVGNGAFRYARHDPKTLIEFEANPDWWGGEPAVKRLVLRFGEANLTHLLAGDIDMMMSVSPLTAMKVEDDPRFYVYHEWIPAGNYIVWNVNRPPLEDVRVRRALGLALDRKALHGLLGFPDSVPVTDGIYTPCQFVRRDLPPALPFDPVESRRLLEEAGWRDGDGDGIREKHGRPLRFELGAGSPLAQQSAVFVQDRLARVGADVQVVTREPTISRELVRSGDFDAFIGSGAGDGWQFVRRVLDEIPGGYRNPEVRRLLARTDSLELSQRDSIAGAISAVVREDLPITFLYPTLMTHIIASRIQGLSEWRGPLSFIDKARIVVRE